MTKGIYSALSGAMAKMTAVENLSNNLTNAHTFGFKKSRCSFEALLNSASQNRQSQGVNFTRIRKNFIDFSQGTNQPTGGALDFAIEGEGFFKVKEGENIYYTRLGKFSLGADGTLMTPSGLTVVGEKDQPIILPGPDVEVDEKGAIFSKGSNVGRILVYKVNDTGLLQKRGGGLFVPAAGVEDKVVEEPLLLRGSLETSNVNLMEEMAMMVDNLRVFEAYQKILKTYNTMSSKWDELGSVG